MHAGRTGRSVPATGSRFGAEVILKDNLMPQNSKLNSVYRGLTPTEMMGGSSEAMAFFRATAVELPLTLFAESLRFMGHRMQAQAEHLSAIARCRTPAEILEAQSSFTQTAVSEYRSEADAVLSQVKSILPKTGIAQRRQEAA